MTSLSVLIPVYNNESTIYELVSRIQEAVHLYNSQLDFEVVIVNDGSNDNSWKEIEAICSKWDNCTALDFSRNFGQHPAINAGLSNCSGEVVVLMDADLQDLPEELPKIVDPILRNSNIDIVYTQFELQHDAEYRLSSRIFNFFFSKAIGKNIPPRTGTYRAFRSHVKDALLQYPERGAVYGPLMVQLGFCHVFVTVTRAAAVGRRTSYSFRKRASLAVASLISYSMFLQWIVFAVGISATALSFIFLAVMTFQYLFVKQSFNNGQTLLIGITLLLSSVVIIFIGILTVYVTQMFREVLNRPRFHISKVIKSRKS